MSNTYQEEQTGQWTRRKSAYTKNLTTINMAAETPQRAIRIQYRSGDDELSDRVISNITVESTGSIAAFCHLHDAEREFKLKRIVSACDAETGEVIDDIWIYLGLPSEKPIPPSLPQFDERRTRLTDEEAKRRRTEDKRKLFNRFKIDELIEVKRKELRGLFSHQCFKCGDRHLLQFDHHLPQALGGRLVPGNVGLLCSRCNSLKGERHPKAFYTDEELERLQPIFEAQLKLFDFTFDWRRYEDDPIGYLTSLGVSREDAERKAKEREERIGVRFSLSESGGIEIDPLGLRPED